MLGSGDRRGGKSAQGESLGDDPGAEGVSGTDAESVGPGGVSRMSGEGDPDDQGCVQNQGVREGMNRKHRYTAIRVSESRPRGSPRVAFWI